MLARFVFVFMIVLIATVAAYLMFSYQLMAGPAYYVDAGVGGINPIQPRFRIPITKVKARPSVLAVSMDGRGNLYEFRHLRYGVEDSRFYYYYDMNHRLRYKGTPDRSGHIHLHQMSPP